MKKSYKSLQESVSHDNLIATLRRDFDTIKDIRASNCSYTLPDLLMSVFAMFTLKYESLLEFDKQSKKALLNLKQIFGINTLSSDSCLRKVLDKVDWKFLRPLFSDRFFYLKKLGIVKAHLYLNGYTLVSVDGVEHFSSKKIHCACCLTKKHKSGDITYTHSMLCAAMVHPDQSEVFIVGTEPIQCQDGEDKNDCERNAKKRLINWMSTVYSNEKLLFLEDALYSTAPNIKQIRENNWDFILGVKPDGNKYLFRILDEGWHNNKPIYRHTYEEDGEKYVFSFFNDVIINESNREEKVNFLHCKQVNKKGKVTNFSWVTSLKITSYNVVKIMRAGRSRWKIENETFNTLKNQGYRFEHNYGHGHENLSCIFSHLMLLAFLTDQIVQRCYKLFQVLWKTTVTKIKLWSMLKAAFVMKAYNDFHELYRDVGYEFGVKVT